jgi:GTP cyclohydrolase FolE2
MELTNSKELRLSRCRVCPCAFTINKPPCRLDRREHEQIGERAFDAVDRTGKSQREGVEAIAAFIKSNAPHVARIGLETGGNVDMAVAVTRSVNYIADRRQDCYQRIV